MEFEIKSKQKLDINLKELWEYKELFYFFTWRDLKVKYKQTVLGTFWVLLQPFMLMVVFTFFFSRTLKIDSGLLPYPVFAYSGLMLWSLFSSGISNAGNSMLGNSNIIKKIYFPRLIIPLSSILSSCIDFFITCFLFPFLLMYFHTSFSFSQFLLALPISLLITLLTTIGTGCFLAAINIKYRDFRYIIPFSIQLLLFLTPVIYPMSILPSGWIKDILTLNPMLGAIETFRAPFSGAALDTALILKSTLISFLFFLAGITYFRKTEYYFADLA